MYVFLVSSRTNAVAVINSRGYPSSSTNDECDLIRFMFARIYLEDVNQAQQVLVADVGIHGLPSR